MNRSEPLYVAEIVFTVDGRTSREIDNAMMEAATEMLRRLSEDGHTAVLQEASLYMALAGPGPEAN